ncbi:MAG: hypothetical protein EZS28_004649 [Streblomastix strix]|uniref:Reverse transcriptase domain-containing protein n=1 Tax=Streblomastix strix TaxID=222440 RepID=A0A5J4WZ77_9EUKA|nr:MAG: hypothetical protein EZS28_004649 [Streblomastix strix]
MEGEDGEQNGAQSRMQKDEVHYEDDDLLGLQLKINTQILLIASCHRATIIIPQLAVETRAIQTQVRYEVGARLLYFLPQWRSIDKCERILRCIALSWRDQDSAHNIEVLRHKTAFKGDLEAHSSLSKIIQQELEDDVITQVQDFFVKCWNPIFAISKKKEGWRKILDCRILNSELETEYFMVEGITDIQEIIMPNDWTTTIDLHQAFRHIRVAEEKRPYLCFSFNGLSYSNKGMSFGVSTAL